MGGCARFLTVRSARSGLQRLACEVLPDVRERFRPSAIDEAVTRLPSGSAQMENEFRAFTFAEKGEHDDRCGIDEAAGFTPRED